MLYEPAELEKKYSVSVVFTIQGVVCTSLLSVKVNPPVDSYQCYLSHDSANV